MPTKTKQPAPVVRVLRNFQITIPASLRKKAALNEGDFLEVRNSKNGILLKPRTVIDRKKALRDLQKTFAKINKNSPYAGMSDDEIMEEAIKIVAEVRAEDKSKK